MNQNTVHPVRDTSAPPKKGNSGTTKPSSHR